MSTITKHKGMWRAAAVVFFAVAMVGPWAYDMIHVPAQYSCDGPNIRLQGDFCGLPLSLLWALGTTVEALTRLTSGEIAFSDLSATFLFWSFFPLFFTLPAVITLLLVVRRGPSTGWQRINILVSGLAAIGGGVYIALQLTRPHSLPWGAALYAGVALIIVALEAVSRLMAGRDVQPVP